MTADGRTLSLGPDGEREWQRLRANYQTFPDGGRVLLIADSGDVRAEIRRRLEMLGNLQRLAPHDAMLESIYAHADDRRSTIIWIEAPSGSDVQVWIPALLDLNRGRDILGDRGGIFLVLAGDRALYELLSVQAPDLAHVLDSVLLVGNQLDVLVQPTGPLCWMHLSDLHIRTHDWEQDIVLRSLLRDLPGLLAQTNRRPGLLFVTGDVANSGERPQYEAAERFFSQLCATLNIAQSRVFAVPGNHDVERKSIKVTARLAQESLTRLKHDERRRVVGDLIGDEDEFALFGARLNQWCAFTQRYLGPRGVKPSRPFASDIEVISGVRVGVASLCTAWMSGPEKDRKEDLVLGARQVRELADELDAADAHIKFALLHHPLDWLEDGEAGEVEAILRKRFDLVLHGHLHRRHARCENDGTDQIVWAGAGAAYERHGDRWQGFFVGQIDSERAQVELDAFTWTSHDAGRWHPDTSFGETSARRVLPFRPAKLGPTSVSSESGLEALAARLRQTAQRVYRTLSFAGFPKTSGWPAATLADIFVPPHLQKDSDSTLRTFTQFETSVLLSAARNSAKRAVIRGGPGSGKSTLCKHLAIQGADDKHALVPILLTVRRWVSGDFDRSLLLNHAAQVAEDMLSSPVDEAQLRQLCESGRVVLIIDGVDAATTLERETLRARIHGFADSYPNVPVLVTSRISGYDEVRFDESFEHLTLSLFDDDQVLRFVEKWYGIAERSPQQAQNGARELLDAFVALPQVRQLAHSPLLLTLIAALHHQRGALPGHRADLFQGCIELLADTWPRANRRLFSELPGDAQIERLELLALVMQWRRALGMSERFLVHGAELERDLNELLARRGHNDRQDLARRWLRWLVEADILQEQSHDRYAFLHLSMMEYLAGQALLRELLENGHGQVVEFVARHHRSTHWHETLLLMIGSRMASQKLREAVVDHLIPDSNGLFLLGLLREELEFDDARREAILEAVARSTLLENPRRSACRKSMHALLTSSRLHSAAIRRWFDHELGTRRGEDLIAVLALLPPNYELPAALEQRDASDLHLVPLLEFGHTEAAEWRWGPWVHARMHPDLMLEWVRTCALRGILPHALENLTFGLPYAGAWIVGLQRRMCWLAGAMRKTPAAVRWRSATCNVAVGGPLTVRCATAEVENAQRLDNPHYLNTAFWDISLYVELELQRLTPRQLPQRTYRQFTKFGRSRWAEANLTRLFPRGPAERRDPSILGEVFADLAQQLYHNPTPLISPALVAPRLSSESPHSRPSPNAAPSLPWELDTALPEPLPDTWPILVAFFATFHAGASSARESAVSNVVGESCVQNLAINLFFDGILDLASRTPVSPDRQALLLALGLAQFQTTRRWPLSERWQEWFASPTSPDHWLSAYVWHLCWAAAEPETKSHVEAARECLDSSDWPALADALREHSVAPTLDISHS
jgi:UDP-2,3-diacylglucosamine pyrophosphatase LpxH